MPPGPRKLRWFWIPIRVLLVTFLLALLSFAVCLLLGILGITIAAVARGSHPNLTLAYRDFAFPAAIIAGVVALIAAIALELQQVRTT
jgi:hypothetical protein